MSIATKCDNCGSFFDKKSTINDKEILGIGVLYPHDDRSFYLLQPKIDKKDICQTCLDKMILDYPCLAVRGD